MQLLLAWLKGLPAIWPDLCLVHAQSFIHILNPCKAANVGMLPMLSSRAPSDPKGFSQNLALQRATPAAALVAEC